MVFWIVVGTVTLLGMWSAATATYFAFRDDVLTRLIARQAEMQYAYEDRIAELRAKVDRTTSRQLLDQEQFDQKLDQIMRRQTALESRATRARRHSRCHRIDPAARRERAAAEATRPATPKPSPISDTVIFVAPPDREARLESRAPIVIKPPPNQFAKVQGVDNVLVRLQTSLDQVESRQMAALNSVEDGMESRVRRMRGVITDLGLDMAQLEAATPRARHGRSVHSGQAFGRRRPVRARSSIASTSPAPRWTASTARWRWCPIASPSSARSNSPPASGSAAIRSSAAPPCIPASISAPRQGDPVRATANGKVASAGWAGGYGRMVEIDHGNGLSTRYGHLSEINVKVGDPIKIGQVIGAVGSTGRSTGPHLHYETRIDGEAVDPQKFLRAGVRLSAG